MLRMHYPELPSAVVSARQGQGAGDSPRRSAWNIIAGAAGDLFVFCRQNPRWLMLIGAFIAIWTLELYLVQATTLVYPNDTGPRFAFWAPKIRLALDLLFIASLSLWLRRRGLIVVVVGAFFIYLGLVTYHHFFHQSLSILTVITNWHEGWAVGGFAFELFPRVATLALLAALAIKLSLLTLLRHTASLPRNCAWLCGITLMVAYLSFSAATNLVDPLSEVQTTRGVGRLGEIRGYMGPWLAEWYYLADNQVLTRALERRKVVYDRLSPLEANIPIHKKLVILQAESLDFNVLGHTVEGQEVTPFLNQLRYDSMFYRVRAMHYKGSSDADFVALTGVAGSQHVNTYRIAGYPFGENTTPQLLTNCGYDVFSFHGYTGDFYARRRAYEKMGFTNFYFQEELESHFGLQVTKWGVYDREVLAMSSLELRNATRPTCHFIVTLTTHTPYTFLAPQDRQLFPKPRNHMQNYYNNMRFLDNCLRDYITSLGKGVTIMIYADHPIEEGDETMQPDRDRGGSREFIPCFIYDTDQDLSKVQQTRDSAFSRDGSLNLVDMISYLRLQIARNCK